ncbi:MAG: 2Fe-2S iron-sulfur cluster binding domain-containing protein [Clostridiales bacterium]|jgi:ferredoxin|nr:2Fe-2S iron-sulfur cluster binding domain-containing protein [Clostridiales bacterium]
MFVITLEEGRESFLCREDETVLAAMLRQRRGHLRCGCFGGGCGICVMRIISGAYHQIKPMSRAHVSEAEQAESVVLLCCVEPRGDIVLARVNDLKKNGRYNDGIQQNA